MTGVGVARRTAAVAAAVLVTTTGCNFHGINSLPLPGTVGNAPGAHTYTVELANVGTLEANSPVMIDDVVVGNVRRIWVADRHANVQISVRGDTSVPANAIATVGQTSLLGSMHLALGPPMGATPAGVLPSGSTIPLDRSATYPSTEQTLASLSAVVNTGGLGQIGDIIHSFNAAFTGRQGEIRALIGRLDTFVGTLNDQRENIIATVSELNRFSATLAAQSDLISRALHDIPQALDVLIRERPRLTEALERLRVFSETATGVVTDTSDALVRDLRNLEPTLRALNDVGSDIGSALAFATVFPLGQDIINRGVRGDYMNLFVTVDLTNARLKRGLLAGTRWADEDAKLVPAPGDPGYDGFYSNDPLGVGVPPPAQPPAPAAPSDEQGGG